MAAEKNDPRARSQTTSNQTITEGPPTRKKLREALKNLLERGVVTDSIHEGESWERCTFCGEEASLGLEPSHKDNCAYKNASDLNLELIDDESLERDEKQRAEDSKARRILKTIWEKGSDAICSAESDSDCSFCENDGPGYMEHGDDCIWWEAQEIFEAMEAVDALTPAPQDQK